VEPFWEKMCTHLNKLGKGVSFPLKLTAVRHSGENLPGIKCLWVLSQSMYVFSNFKSAQNEQQFEKNDSYALKIKRCCLYFILRYQQLSMISCFAGFCLGLAQILQRPF
jgi:hypothetical protein